VKTSIILDTGPLVALIDSRDRHHDWSESRWSEIAPPLLTCESVISEACFLLDQTRAGGGPVFEMIARKAIRLSFRLDERVRDIAALRKKYANVPMSVADACLVRMAEQVPGSAVLTLDGGFRIYRKHDRQVIPLILPPDVPSRRVPGRGAGSWKVIGDLNDT
jgi:predicted nucleic acid-binding protein